jgi:hypothetical protein
MHLRCPSSFVHIPQAGSFVHPPQSSWWRQKHLSVVVIGSWRSSRSAGNVVVGRVAQLSSTVAAAAATVCANCLRCATAEAAVEAEAEAEADEELRTARPARCRCCHRSRRSPRRGAVAAAVSISPSSARAAADHASARATRFIGTKRNVIRSALVPFCAPDFRERTA